MSQKTKTEVTQKKPSFFVSAFDGVLKIAAEFQGWDLIFQGLMYGFFIWAVYNLKIVYDFHTDPFYSNISKYSILEFKTSFICVGVFFVKLFSKVGTWFF